MGLPFFRRFSNRRMLHLLLLALLAPAALGTWVELEEWTSFKLAHGKQYSHQLEELKRMKTYAVNKAYVLKHNAEADAGQHTYWLAVNKFADMTNEEFRAQMNRYKPTTERLSGVQSFRRTFSAPESQVWRAPGISLETTWYPSPSSRSWTARSTTAIWPA